jgi:hypothetical protein
MFVVEIRKYDMYGDIDDGQIFEYHDEDNANRAFEYIIETYLNVNGFNKETFKSMDNESFDEIINNKYATLFGNKEQLNDVDLSVQQDRIGKFFLVYVVEREDEEDPVLDNDYLIRSLMRMEDCTKEDVD